MATTTTTTLPDLAPILERLAAALADQGRSAGTINGIGPEGLTATLVSVGPLGQAILDEQDALEDLRAALLARIKAGAWPAPGVGRGLPQPPADPAPTPEQAAGADEFAQMVSRWREGRWGVGEQRRTLPLALDWSWVVRTHHSSFWSGAATIPPCTGCQQPLVAIQQAILVRGEDGVSFWHYACAERHYGLPVDEARTTEVADGRTAPLPVR